MEDMSSPGFTRRTYFQFSLSTALVLTLAASGLVWLNLSKLHITEVSAGDKKDSHTHVKYTGQGWPWPLYEGSISFPTDAGFSAENQVSIAAAQNDKSLTTRERIAGWAMNVILGCGMLFVLAIVSERFVFRRAGSRENHAPISTQPVPRRFRGVMWLFLAISLGVTICLNARPQKLADINEYAVFVPSDIQVKWFMVPNVIRGYGWPYTAVTDWGATATPQSVFILWKYVFADVVLGATPALLIFFALRRVLRRNAS